nr:RNA-directed DNA polymerase homolog [Tanacetum cinerariifolium]
MGDFPRSLYMRATKQSREPAGFFQIPIAPEDQEKTTFTYPYGNFAYKRMSFGLYNAPATFQRCMTEIFHDMVKDFMEVFTDDFSVRESAHGGVNEREIADEFPDEHLMVLRSKFNDDEPWTLLNENDDIGGVFIFWNYVCCSHAGMDIAKITRKEPKPDKNGHENRKGLADETCSTMDDQDQGIRRAIKD